MQIKIGDILKIFSPEAALDKKKLILLGVFCCLFIYLDVSFVLNAQLKAIARLSPRITKIKNDIDAFDKDMRAVNEFKQKGAGSQALKQEARLSRKVIREEEMPALLQDITGMANKVNLKILQIRPFKDMKAKEETVGGLRLVPVMISLELRCGYHALGNFINAIENSTKFMLVESVKINSNGEDYLNHNIKVEIRTYVKK